ncbi:hypothetical protein AWM79_07065 [Pseudomonas agarici]|uniref:Major facilitator superfamily (MFS) profile domain-containing protein n=1 Tax=Pseudomonas agarici TaxID=46677 RepID=A0A0X1SZ10_PSEAA|nr:MFS transporter [Pseudomonas agarici]AMB85082.1 hypothetical protein AWM79_07065 [Pseudomonas agarici]NWB91430.1 MFS transporter [Pseudomonas agarici]
MREIDPVLKESAALPTSSFRERYSVMLSLLLPALLLGLGRGFTIPVLPLIARDEFHVGAAGAALTFIAIMLGSAGSTVPCGYLVDKIGRRKVLIAGPLLTAVSSLLVLVAGSYTQLLVYLFINGVGLQMWQMGRLAAIADTNNKGRTGRMMTGMAGVQRTGTMLGPFLGGIVGSFFGLRMPFVFCGILALLAAIPMFMFVKESAPGILAKRRGEPPQEAVDNSWGNLLTPSIIVLFIAQFTANLSRGGAVGNTGPPFIFAAYAYGLDAIQLGTISLVTGAVGIPVTFLSGYIMDRFGRKQTVVPASAVLGVGLGLLAATAAFHLSVAIFIAAFVLINLAVSFMAGSLQTIGADIAPVGARGKFFGIGRLLGECGSLANPVVFAAAVSTVALPNGYALGFSIMGFGGLFTAVLIGRLLKETLVRR